MAESKTDVVGKKSGRTFLREPRKSDHEPAFLYRDPPKHRSHEKKTGREISSTRALLLLAFVLPLTFFWQELTAHFIMFHENYTSAGVFFGQFFPSLLRFSVSAAGLGALLALILWFVPFTVQRVLTMAVQAVSAVFFCIYEIYRAFFQDFYSWHSVNIAGDFTQFWKETVLFTLQNFYMLVIAFLPLILYGAFAVYSFVKRVTLKRRMFAPVVLFVTLNLAISGFVASLVFSPAARDDLTYQHGRGLANSYREFGVITASSLDLWQSRFGAPEEELDDPGGGAGAPVLPPKTTETATETGEPVTEEKDLGYNVMEIDFESLIASAPNATVKQMHEYFSQVEPTKKTKYTGMFKGYNLIVLTLESFSDRVVELAPELFPTLYQMIHGGFHFTNFYHPTWGGSTATGEYSVMTGNFYTTANCMPNSANTLQYFAFGNLFRRAGYETFAYHNNSYTYYSRHRSHPNFGYTYKAEGNGLVLRTTNGWPASDREMAEVTGPEFISADRTTPFHAYYMTVSGHGGYGWTHAQSKRHKAVVSEALKDSGLSESVKAYIACNYEVELMMQELIRQLSEAGQLENTVFAMCCDHYPYALSDSDLAQLYGIPASGIKKNYELYHNGLIIWSASMTEPVEVDMPCCSYDLLPTVANLLGVEYDSRLITGRDILSLDDNVALVNVYGGGYWNWISTQGSYNTTTKKFTPNENCILPEELIPAYVEQWNKYIEARRKYSAAILDKDYYRIVFKEY